MVRYTIFAEFYVDDENLFFTEGKTWALSNQWSIKFLPKLDQLIGKYPDAQISYNTAAEPDND